jgi:exoribonuclease R
MQYYIEYLKKSSIEIDKNILLGIYKNIENNSYIEVEKDKYINIENNRAINNDIVYYINNNIVGIHTRNICDIVGILYLDSKIKYGNINDKSLYLFKPTNKSYPNFYIPYKIKNNKNKIFCTINFKEWKITDKLPIGTLINIIGNIGIKEYEIEHMRIYYGINNNTWKIDNIKKNNDLKIINDLQEKIENYEVFSIDPVGSKDIDDAFHFKNIEKNEYEVGIHIASPTIFFENNYLEILERVSTVYLPNKKYNLLPNIYADEIISLLENKKRFALSLILKINNNVVISYEIKETVVKNIKNYDYDTFDKILKKNEKLSDFMNLTKKFFNIDIIDSHKLVEFWMIYTNKFIAKYLVNNGFSNIILRSHQLNIKNKEFNIDECLNNYLSLKEESSALYVIYDKNESNQYHSKLDNEYYTHFTSPIRRSIDFYIHMLLLNKIKYNDNNIIILIDKINSFTKKCRKFDRIIRRLNFLYDIKELNKNIETYGYIINITKNKLTLYIPEYNLEEKVSIVPYKFENAYSINIENNWNTNSTINENNDNITKIIISNENITKVYKLYEKINIKLWVFTSFENIFDKLKIEII